MEPLKARGAMMIEHSDDDLSINYSAATKNISQNSSYVYKNLSKNPSSYKMAAHSIRSINN